MSPASSAQRVRLDRREDLPLEPMAEPVGRRLVGHRQRDGHGALATAVEGGEDRRGVSDKRACRGRLPGSVGELRRLVRWSTGPRVGRVKGSSAIVAGFRAEGARSTRPRGFGPRATAGAAIKPPARSCVGGKPNATRGTLPPLDAGNRRERIARRFREDGLQALRICSTSVSASSGSQTWHFIQAMARISQTITPYLEAIAPYVEAIAPYLEHFARFDKFIDAVHATGWLPYHTVAIDCVEECGDDVALLEARLLSFYKDNWEDIRQDIAIRLDQYHISEETRSTFREALSAHGIGHYRCVCCVIFPVIDREFRVHFFEDNAGSISSKKMLEQLTNRGELRNFLPREAYGWMYSVTGCGTDFLQWKWAEMNRAVGEVAA